MRRFEVAAILDDAWGMTRRSYWSWWPVVLLAVALPVLLQLLSGALSALSANLDIDFLSVVFGFLAVLVYLAGLLVSAWMALGLIRNAYVVSGGGRPSVVLLFSLERYGWFLVAGLLYVGIVVLGLFLLVIPGIIFGFMLMLFGYSLVSGECGNGFAALGMSWDRISRQFWGFVGLRVVLLAVPMALVLLGALVLGLVGAGVFGTMTAIGGGGGGFLSVILGLIGMVGLVFAYVFAVIFTIVSDGLAFRRLAAEDVPA